MNPNSERIPTPDISTPASNGEAMPQSVGFGHEQQRPATERQPISQKPQQQPYLAPLPTQSQVSIASTQPTAPPMKPGATASDELAIEKECITRAKAIVEQTKSDPFTQSKELSKVKAEFLKKQYGKEIKLSEGS